MVDWAEIDTVLLDMDGTLLDLRYDNTLWNDLVPARYSQTHGIELAEARAALYTKMREIRGRLEFYCLDQWARFTKLDIIALHEELAHLIDYRPNAQRFLAALQHHGKQTALVTNAHRGSLEVKDAHSQLVPQLDIDVSSHDYGAPKEDVAFWHRLQLDHPFDPRRTLLIDDSATVLDAAADFGIVHLLTIEQPDSGRPPRDDLAHRAITDFAEIMPGG